MDDISDDPQLEQSSWLKSRSEAAEIAAPSLDQARTRGTLGMSEVPLKLRYLRPLAHRLHVQLEAILETVDLVLTDNRRRMLSSKQRRGRFEIRAHHMFMGCEPEIAEAIARLVGAKDQRLKAAARDKIQAYIRAHHDTISFEPSAGELAHRGEHFHLGVLLEEVVEGLEPALKDALGHIGPIHITWGRRGQGTRSIRFGSYDFDRKLIRIHPALDRDWVPRYFISFIVYHELLHALFPPRLADDTPITSAAASSKRSREGRKRRLIHTPEFVAMERRFVHYDKAMRWEAANLQRILEHK